MFGQIVDTLDKWLNRRFLLAYFSPWLVFAFANGVIAFVTFPAAEAYISRYVTGNPADKAIVIAAAVAAIAIVAYLSAPLVPGMTEVLEGRWLPEWLAAQLTVLHAEDLAALDERRSRLLAVSNKLKEFSNVVPRLQDAREQGVQGRHNLKPEQIDAANRAVGILRKHWYRNELIEPHEIKNAADALSAALANNCADPARLKKERKGDPALSQKLAAAHRDFVYKLLDYAIDVAVQKHFLTRIERYRRFAKAELAPTRLGNDAATLRSYCETRYNLDFDFFWPRLQILFQRDQNLSTALINSKTQLDFAVLLCWLTALFTGVWLVILAFWGNSLGLFAGVAALGPLAARIWLAIVQACYAAFAELVRSAIDLKRLDLVTALHWPLPPTADAELLTWEAIGERMVVGPGPRNRETAFRHPPS